jgi:hypothetical protein
MAENRFKIVLRIREKERMMGRKLLADPRKPITFRATSTEREAIAELRRRLGADTLSDAIRIAVLEVAQAANKSQSPPKKAA